MLYETIKVGILILDLLRWERMMSGSMETAHDLQFLTTNQNGNHQLKTVPINGGLKSKEDNIKNESETIRKKSLNSICEGLLAYGSNVTKNGPMTANVQIDENEEPKSVQNARSTDLLLLKSVVASNTLERQKKVGFIFYIKYNEKLPMNTRIQELSDKDLQCYTLQTWDIPQDLK